MLKITASCYRIFFCPIKSVLDITNTENKISSNAILLVIKKKINNKKMKEKKMKIPENEEQENVSNAFITLVDASIDDIVTNSGCSLI